MIFIAGLFEGYVDHQYLRVLTHSFPTRRSSDLRDGETARDCLDPVAEGGGKMAFRLADAAGRHDRRRQCEPARCLDIGAVVAPPRSEEHTSELQSLMRISYAVFCLTTKNTILNNIRDTLITPKRYH